MPFDRDEFIAGLATDRKRRTQEQLPALRAVQAQAVVMEKLLVTPEWNRYLSYLQELVNKATAARDLAIRKLTEDAAVWEQAEMVRLKSEIAEARGMLTAFEIAMKLPKALIDDAAKADELVKQYGEKGNETPDQSKP